MDEIKAILRLKQRYDIQKHIKVTLNKITNDFVDQAITDFLHNNDIEMRIGSDKEDLWSYDMHDKNYIKRMPGFLLSDGRLTHYIRILSLRLVNDQIELEFCHANFIRLKAFDPKTLLYDP